MRHHRGMLAGAAAVLLAAPLVWLPSATGAVPAVAPTTKPTTPKPTRSTHRPTATPKAHATPAATRSPAHVTTAAYKAGCAPNYQTPPLTAGQIASITPWPQYLLNPKSAWQLTQGKGVTVAVVDSGVDGGHPQLRGQVVQSIDLTHTTPKDCYGHGTAVAAIIAGVPLNGVPFVGIAPQAKIVSVKFVTGEDSSAGNGASAPMPDAIRAAVDAHASIINVSAVSDDTQALRDAVQYAQQKDVLIVAAAGNVNNGQQAVTEYPASYNGVLSVAALKQDGSVTGFSNDKSRVDVASPGEGILSAAVGGGYLNGLEGTSYSSPYVAGVAALVRSRMPQLSYLQVIQRIRNTADGNLGVGTGGGMVNPDQALTRVDVNAPVNAHGGVRAVDITGAPPADPDVRRTGLLFALTAIGAALLVGAAAVIVPAGRRRGWRPTRAAQPRPKPDE